MTCLLNYLYTFTVLVELRVQEEGVGEHLPAFYLCYACVFISVSRSVTLVGEADRKMLKAAIKHSSGEDKIRHRIIPAEVVQTWFEKLENLNSEIADILTEEKEERQVGSSMVFCP
jgi:hypothetical protein